MSVFSSKKKTQVHTSVVRVMEDGQLPNSVGKSVIEAVIKGSQVSDALLENMLNGPVLKVDRMYDFAKRGDYSFGLPNARLLTNTDGKGVVTAVLEAEVGFPVTIDYFEFAPINNTHVGWQALVDTYGYDHASNEIQVLSEQHGATVYLDNIVAVYPTVVVEQAEHGSTQSWGQSPQAGYTPERPAQQDTTLGQYALPSGYNTTTIGEEQVILHYVYTDAVGALQRNQITVSMATYDADKEYYQVKYRYQDANNQTVHRYWTYIDNGGLHPTIDAIYDVSYTDPGTYFPFVLFRHHRENRTDPMFHDTVEYKSTVELMKYLGMDYQSTGDNIHENPDIDKVEQAVLMLAVPAISTDQMDLRYLFDFFNRLYQQTPETGINIEAYTQIPRGKNAIVISDADYKVTISYGDVTRRVKAGKIGPVGTYEGSEDTIQLSALGTVRVYNEAGTTTETRTVTVDVPRRLYRKQISGSLYEEITVVNPTMRYDIYKDYSYLGESDSSQLIIPLDKSITDTYNVIDKEKLYFRSLHYVFNSRVTQTVKWYQSSFFKFVLIVAAIVITAITAGAAYGPAMAALSLGLTALAMALFLLTTLVLVLGAMLFRYAFRLIVKEIGLEYAFIVAVVLAVVGGGFAIKDTQSMWAQSLLSAANGLSQGIQYESQRQIAGYNSETQAFELYKEQQWEELEEVNNLLDSQSLLDPFAFIGQTPVTIHGESPEMFYNRTVHSGNIGTLAFEHIHSYVDVNLKLPDFNDTIGA